MNPWTLLVNALASSLAFFYDLIPEYGSSIILLTLAVGLLLFPLTVKQTRSMRAMSLIQPDVKKLQKEFKGDREELNKRLAALYQERGVSPAAGCLPMIVQMPIWFALYRVLWQGQGIPETSALGVVITDANEALEAGVAIMEPVFSHVTFLGMNLLVSPSTAVDFGDIPGSLPYIVLLLVIMAAGFYQQVQTTRKKSTDPNEELNSQMQGMQNVMKIMPVVFGFISWNFVAGLGLYFATSNLFRIGQQAIILRLSDDEDEGDTEVANKDPDPPSSDEPENAGPSKHASKKRNRRRRK